MKEVIMTIRIQGEENEGDSKAMFATIVDDHELCRIIRESRSDVLGKAFKDFMMSLIKYDKTPRTPEELQARIDAGEFPKAKDLDWIGFDLDGTGQHAEVYPTDSGLA